MNVLSNELTYQLPGLAVHLAIFWIITSKPARRNARIFQDHIYVKHYCTVHCDHGGAH